MEGNISAENKPPDLSSEPDYRFSYVPPISGFWRRWLALLIDGLLLGVAGQVLGWSMSSHWFEIGPYGRMVGFAASLIYFGVMGSRVAGGATIGKRMMGIAVRNKDGQPIGILRSIARTSIWVVPMILNGWELRVMRIPIVTWVAAVILFGIGGAVLLTMVFNRRTRQGLHDLLAGTYVLRLDADPVAALPVAGRAPWILASVTVAIAVALSSVGDRLLLRVMPPLENILALQRKLERNDRFFSVSVLDQTFYKKGAQTDHVLRIHVWYKGVPSDATRTKVMNEIAATALSSLDVEKFALIRIDIESRYELGVASGRLTHGEGQPVSIWRERIAKRGV